VTITSAAAADLILERLRHVPGFEDAALSGEPQPITGGFWATLLLLPLDAAPVPAVVLRLMPDTPLTAKETAFQREAFRQGFPVPEILLAGDRDAGLGRAYLVMAHIAGAPPLAGLDGVAALRRLPSTARALPQLLGSVMAQLHTLDPAPFLALRDTGVSVETTDLLDSWTAWADALGRTDVATAAARLSELRPTPAATVVCHGDLHPFNLLVDADGKWTLLDWTAAVIAEPAYDISFTSILLRHPPLAVPRMLQPAIDAAGAYVTRRFQASYQANGQSLPDPARLAWHTALHSVRILLEVEAWRHDGTVADHLGHPWLSIGRTAAAVLSRATGTAVTRQ